MGAAAILHNEYIIPELGDCRVYHADEHKISVEKISNKGVSQTFVAEDFYSHVNNKVFKPKPAANDEFVISAKMLKQMHKREPILTALKKLYEGGCAPTSSKTYERLCQYLRNKYGSDFEINAKSTIDGWWRTYRKAHFDVAKSLFKDDSASKRLSSHQEDLIFKHLEDTFLTDKSKCRTVAQAHCSYEDDPDLQEKPVSYSTFNRRWLEIDEIIRTLSPASTEQEKRKAFYRLKGKFQLEHVLERVEIDATSYNLALIDENGNPTQTIQIFAAIDCNSWYPLAVIIKFGPGESSEDYQRLLREMVNGTRPSLNANGIPFLVVADNGGGTRSQVTREVFRNAKIDYKTLPPHTPWGKGFVERFFGYFEKDFLQEQPYSYNDKKGNKVTGKGVPGYLCDSDDYRGHKPSAQRAAVTVSEFIRRMDLFLSEFVNTAREGLDGRTSQQVWDESSAELNFTNNIQDEAQFNHAFMLPHKGVSRQLNPNGSVYFDNSYYEHPELFSLYHKLNIIGADTVYVDIHYSIFDVRVIKVVVKSPDSEGFIVIYANRINSQGVEHEVPYKTSSPKKIKRVQRDVVESERPVTAVERRKEAKAIEDAKKAKPKNKKKDKKTKPQNGIKVPIHNLDEKPIVDLAKLIKNGNKHLPRTVYDEIDSDIGLDTQEEENKLEMKVYTKDDQADLFKVHTENKPDVFNQANNSKPKKWPKK